MFDDDFDSDDPCGPQAIYDDWQELRMLAAQADEKKASDEAKAIDRDHLKELFAW